MTSKWYSCPFNDVYFHFFISYTLNALTDGVELPFYRKKCSKFIQKLAIRQRDLLWQLLAPGYKFQPIIIIILQSKENKVYTNDKIEQQHISMLE